MARGPGKGKTNNPNGRPKGTSNKVTIESREILNNILSGRIEQVGTALDELYKDDKHKWLVIMKDIMAFIIPKKRDITSDDKPIQPAITIKEERTDD